MDTSPLRALFAWGVHAITASGAVVGTAALLSIFWSQLDRAVLWMLLALVIDSVDGTLARWARVAEVVPRIDGRRLDDIIDYLNYVVVPTVFLITAGSLAHPAWGALPLLASAYGFSQREAKTQDDFFLGFPSYWNVLAIYLWLFGVPSGLGTAMVVAFALAVLVPWKYVYPSRMPALRRTTAAAFTLWIAALTLSVAAPERAEPLHLAELSLMFPAYYGVLSLRYGRPGWGRRREKRGVPEEREVDSLPLGETVGLRNRGES